MLAMRTEWSKCERGGSCASPLLMLYTGLLHTSFLRLHASTTVPNFDVCSTCHINATCTTNAGTKTCTCNYGFSGNGITICSDKNECQIGAEKICGLHAACYNTHGSYYCTCNEGYRPSNNMDSFTPNDGTHCTAIDCGTPPILLDTLRYPPFNTIYGRAVQYQCALGYKYVRGNISLICSILGQWEGQALECKAIDCGLPPVLENTVRFPSENTTYRSMVEYKCRTGYVYVRGNTTLVCSALGTWEGPNLECEAVNCNSPPELQNTVRYLPRNTTYGSTVAYQCLAGYMHVGGNGTSVCSAQGQWEGPNLRCEAVDCGSPPELQNTVRYPPGNTTYGNMAEYQCLAGHVRVGGNGTSVCSAQGQWEGPNLKCQVVDCGSPPEVQNTVRYPPGNTTYGSRVEYQCLAGHVLMRGNGTSVCSAQGQWEGPNLECEAVDCGSPPELQNTVQYPPGNTTYGSRVKYQCLAGHVCVGGNDTLVCSAQGQWEGPNLECEAVDCGSPPAIVNTVRILPQNTTYGSMVVYQCLTGYDHVRGNSTSVCSARGWWEGLNMECEVVDCGSPPSLENTLRYPLPNTTYGNKAEYQCLAGYVYVKGNIMLVCTAQGEWEGPSLECKAVDCGSPPVLQNAVLFPLENTTSGSTAVYQCATGYVHQRGNNTSVCTAQGRWKRPNLECEAIDCGTPPMLQSTVLHPPKNTTYGSIAMYQCLVGYVRVRGNITSLCSAQGQWEGADLQCEAVDCGTPAPVPNAWLSPVGQTTYRAEIQYHCKTGFVSEGGNDTMICSEQGQWEGAHFNCSEIDCGIPPIVPHAKLPWYHSTRLGSIVHYQCRDGFYAVSGSNVTICKQEGQWEEVTLVCKVNDFILFNESCLKWKRDGVGARSEDTYLFQIQGERVYQREFFYKESFNYSTTDDSPAMCLDLQPGTNYTVNITALTSQHSAYMQLSMAVTDPPVPDVQVVVVEQILPPLILRRVESKNGPISLYQVIVLPLNLQRSFNCNSQNMRDFFGHQKDTEAYITAEFIAMDVEDGMQFSVGDRLYYREFYNAALETGKSYFFLWKTISEWNYVKKQSCVTLAQLKGSSNNVQIVMILGLGSLGMVGFLLFLCYSVVWSLKARE